MVMTRENNKWLICIIQNYYIGDYIW